MQKVRLGLASLVTGVWLAGYVISYTGGAPAPTELTVLMGGVCSWAFAGQIRDNLRRKDDDDDE